MSRVTTWCLFSIESGNLLESYREREPALEALGRVLAQEPEALDVVALVAFDEQGRVVSTVDGDELRRLAAGS